MTRAGSSGAPTRRGLLAVAALLCAACTTGPPEQRADGGASGSPSTPSPTASPSGSTTPPTSAEPPSGSAPPSAAAFDAASALRTVRRLAGDIGPREATSAAFDEAAGVVAAAWQQLGYDVRRQALRVPAGRSWGVPVPAGRTANVVAEPPGFRADRPHLLVGAHLDTVPQAPGAEDNASGVAVLVELARLASDAPPPLPVVFVAFGAEEPRGPGDARHHYGSRAYVAAMPAARRAALAGMVSLDRVGTGGHVRVCTGGRSPATVQRRLVAAAQRLDVPVRRCQNRASDHWSFEKAGFTVARVGGVPYPQYHSARDRPGVVRAAQLSRVGRVMWEWVRTGGGASR